MDILKDDLWQRLKFNTCKLETQLSKTCMLNSDSEDEYDLPLRPFQEYKDAKLMKRTLSGVITHIDDENRFFIVENEAFVSFDHIGTGERPQPGAEVDVSQERWISSDGLNQNWKTVYCYLHRLQNHNEGVLQIKYIKYIDFDRKLIFLTDSDLVAHLENAKLAVEINNTTSYTPNVGDLVQVLDRGYGLETSVFNISPSEAVNCTGRINHWNKESNHGYINGNISFYISDCLAWYPAYNDEVIFIQIQTRRGLRAINIKQISNNKSKTYKQQIKQKFALKGLRPPIKYRRESTPCFHPTYSVPKDIENAIRTGENLLALMPCLSSKLSSSNYARKMSSLLYCEEVAMTIENELYTMNNATLEHIGDNLYSIGVLDLRNNSPPMVLGDRIVIGIVGDTLVEYHAFIHAIRKEMEIIVNIHPSFFTKKNELVNVVFTLNRFQIRNYHTVVKSKLKTSFLFPNEQEYVPHDYRKFVWKVSYHDLVKEISGLNDLQSEAIKQVLRGGGLCHPMIIFGPAGTGKTSTLVELIRLILKFSTAQLLVTAPSNAAADIIAKRICSVSGFDNVCRWNSMHRLDKAIPEEVLAISDKYVKTARCIISTCFTVTSLPPRKFDFCLIDEAGQAIEPDTMIPISYCTKTTTPQIVLAGDPNQLGPVVKSSYAIYFGLGSSYLARLMEMDLYKKTNSGYREYYVTKLLLNYRTSEPILSLISNLFYDDELVAASENIPLNETFLPNAKIPIIFHRSPVGCEKRLTGSRSWFNPIELFSVLSYCRKILTSNKNADIGVITPYKAQCKEIKKLFLMTEMTMIKVGTTEEFQGCEKDVIIVSTVRSNEKLLGFDTWAGLGFVANKKRTCVTLTRARKMLIIIGCCELLEMDKTWSQFIKFCEKNNCML